MDTDTDCYAFACESGISISLDFEFGDFRVLATPWSLNHWEIRMARPLPATTGCVIWHTRI